MLKEVSIEIIRKCPNKCVHCSSLSDQECSDILSYDKFVTIIDEAAQLGATTICLSGGEPFLHPLISKMILYVHNKGLNCFVYTSGIIFNEHFNRVPISSSLFESIAGKVTKLIFNIEAATPSTYDKIMGTDGCFDALKQSVMLANFYSIVTEAHFVPMKINIDEIEQTVELCRELKIARISFLRLVLHGRAYINRKLIELSKEELDILKRKLISLQANSQVNIRIGMPLSSNNGCLKCEAASGKLNIKYDGMVYPCEVFKNDKISLNGLQPENINNRSLFDIYHNSPYLRYVRELSQNYKFDKGYETCIGQNMINTDD